MLKKSEGLGEGGETSMKTGEPSERAANDGEEGDRRQVPVVG